MASYTITGFIVDDDTLNFKDTTYNDATISEAGLMSASDKVSLEDVIQDVSTIKAELTSSISTSFTFESGVSGISYQCFAFKQGKVVILSCALKLTSDKGTYTKLATLPSGFWPTKEIEFIAMSYYGSGVYTMYITNQGDLYCRNGINATNMLVFNVAYIQA